MAGMPRVQLASPPRRSVPPGLVVSGPVVRGDQRGAELGFPTANLTLASGAEAVADGVYAGWVTGETFGCRGTAVSIGSRSTFYGAEGERLLEAHLVDFDGDLYGQVLSVHLVEKLRGQRRFPDMEALIGQLEQDVERTRAWMLTRTDRPSWSAEGPADGGAW
jgi:FAD synthase